MTKRILFIGHDASRSGAPVVLLNFLKWFKANTSIAFDILLKHGGALEKEYRSVAQTTVLGIPISRKLAKNIRIFGVNLMIEHLYTKLYVKSIENKDNLHLVYSNTSTNGAVLEGLSRLNCPVISHIHELDGLINHYGRKNFRLVKSNTQRYIAVSEAVKQNLVHNHAIPESTVDIIYSFIANNIFPISGPGNFVHRELNISDHSYIIGACGSLDKHKGPDLFIQLATQLVHHTLDRPVYFVWVGGDTREYRFRSIQNEIRKAGVSDRVHFIGSKVNPVDYFSSFDIFVSTSREDSFPLVVLEAAALGIPPVCFEQSGGAKEFVSNDSGCAIPGFDINGMAEKTVQLLRDPGLRHQLGYEAQQKVKNHHLVSVQAPKICDVISRVMS